MPGRTAARTFALSSASACVRARAPCCAATVRCCPASSLSSRSRRARSAVVSRQRLRARARLVLGRAPLANTPARASPASRRTSRSSDPAPVFRTGRGAPFTCRSPGQRTLVRVDVYRLDVPRTRADHLIISDTVKDSQ
jgi:hypothetical protein